MHSTISDRPIITEMEIVSLRGGKIPYKMSKR